MNIINRANLYFLLVSCVSICVILWIINGISISYNEALLYFENKKIIAKLANLSTQAFGVNDFTLRFPNLAFHFINLLLIYLISNRILKYKIDSLLCVGIYALLPAVIMQGVLLNESIIVLSIVLFVCYVELVNEKIAYPLFVLAIFISPSAFIVFLALFLYSLHKKKLEIAIFALICFGINMYIYGINISGRPSGKFLEVVGELSLLYSPPLFIYYVYTLYRNFSRNKITLLLYVSVTSLLVSFILSIRQGIDKEVFLVMSLCGIPLMVRQFLSDIRIRLPMFQNSYKNRFLIVLIFLVFEAMLLIFSKQIYLISNNTDNLFLNQFYIAKEISIELKKKNISKVKIDDKKMQKRLKFYGIDEGGQRLKKVSRNGNIIINYNGRIVARYAI